MSENISPDPPQLGAQSKCLGKYLINENTNSERLYEEEIVYWSNQQSVDDWLTGSK